MPVYMSRDQKRVCGIFDYLFFVTFEASSLFLSEPTTLVFSGRLEAGKPQSPFCLLLL